MVVDDNRVTEPMIRVELDEHWDLSDTQDGDR